MEVIMGVDSISKRALAATSKPAAQATPSTTPPASASAPIKMSQDRLILQTKAPLLDLPGLKAGKSYNLSGSAKGFDLSGDAKVNAFDGHHLDATLDASVLFFSAKLHLKLQPQSDGTFKYDLDRLSGSHEIPAHQESTLTLVSNQSGHVVFKDTQGKQMIINSSKDGKTEISYKGGELDLS